MKSHTYSCPIPQSCTQNKVESCLKDFLLRFDCALEEVDNHFVWCQRLLWYAIIIATMTFKTPAADFRALASALRLLPYPNNLPLVNIVCNSKITSSASSIKPSKRFLVISSLICVNVSFLIFFIVSRNSARPVSFCNLIPFSSI